MVIVEATDDYLPEVLFVLREAFKSDIVANLVKDILVDSTAKPYLSLVATKNSHVNGYILFTPVRINKTSVKAVILAPLAVHPKFQRQGIGGELIRKGLELLGESKIDIVFVLGHPTYYPRYGFNPAEKMGFEAPYPILRKNVDAWMVCELRKGIIGTVAGKVTCCNALMKPQHWHE